MSSSNTRSDRWDRPSRILCRTMPCGSTRSLAPTAHALHSLWRQSEGLHELGIGIGADRRGGQIWSRNFFLRGNFIGAHAATLMSAASIRPCRGKRLALDGANPGVSAWGRSRHTPVARESASVVVSPSLLGTRSRGWRAGGLA